MYRLLFSALILSGLALAAGAADEKTRTAMVAGGGEVELAPSAKTLAEWAKLRPDFEELRPGLTR